MIGKFGRLIGRLHAETSLGRSLKKVGALVARVPAVILERKLQVALLTIRFQRGFGVDVVVAEQVEYFVGRGYRVTVVVLEKDDYYDARFAELVRRDLLRIRVVASTTEASEIIRRSGIEIVIAHSPPFFSLLRELPASVLKVFFDHGEPPAQFFADAEARESLRRDKIEIGRFADLVISISDFVRSDSGLPESIVCRHGNDHLLKRRSDLANLAGGFRQAAELAGNFIVLNVTRYSLAERSYKGLDLFTATKNSLFAAHPEVAEVVRFVVAGRSYSSDRAWAWTHGLLGFSNLSEGALISAYLDSDFYLTTSKWEGYNLGLAQALTFGLDAAASAEGAHPEFGIPVSNEPDQLSGLVYRSYRSWIERKAAGRSAAWLDKLKRGHRHPWRDSLGKLEEQVLNKLKGKRPSLDVENQARTLLQATRRPEAPLISFLVLTKDRPDLLIACVKSIEKYCTVAFEILVGDTGSTDPDLLNYYQNTCHEIFHLGFYNFSICNNILAAKAKGRWLVLINNDVEIVRADFPEVLDYLERNPEVGTLGAYLVYRDMRIQHAGVRICLQNPYRGIPEHFDKFKSIVGYPGLKSPRAVVCVTGAFLIISAHNYIKFGGLDERYQEEAQDADLCLKMMEAGLSNVVHPALLAIHYENATRKIKESEQDRELLLSRHLPFVEREVYRWQAEQGL